MKNDNYQMPEFDRELRLYSFVNFYLSSIQQGVQTGHAAVDLVRKYTGNRNPFDGAITEERTRMVEDWADCHKTFIILNGGDNAELNKIFSLVAASGYPFACFHEDEDSLGGIMTTVSVVLPDDVFNLRERMNTHGERCYSWTRECDNGACVIYQVNQSDQDFEFIDMLKSKGLAR